MRLKTLTLAVVALAAVSIVVYVVRRPGPPPSKDSRVGEPLVARSVLESAAKLRITDEGKSVLLTRQPDGTWRNSSYHELPADFSKLSGFVQNLTDAKLERLVTSNPERISRLEFDDTKVELLDAADKPLWSASLGKTAELGGGRFVKFGDENKAYLASLNAWLDVDAKNWANAELLNVKADEVARIEAEFPATTGDNAQPAGRLVLTRAKKEDAWTAENPPENQKVKPDKVSTLLSYLGNLRFTDTADLSEPNVVAAKANHRLFKLTTFDGKTYTIAMGRKPEEKKLKPPTASTDGKSGPASLGSVADLAKKEDAKEGASEPAKPVAPEFETIPAGPVYVWVTSSEENAPINGLMEKRAFQLAEYTFSGLPQSRAEMFEPVPPAAPASSPAAEQPKQLESKP